VVTIRLGNKLLFNSRNNHILLQGYGLYTMEELKFDKNGRLTTRNAIGYKIPTITLGNAIYDIKGLTSKGVKLDDFWSGYKKVDINLYQNFKNYIIKTTQLNGSFYGMMPKELL
jgi:hypothetical protein